MNAISYFSEPKTMKQLTGPFDMVWAISQDTINGQLAALFGMGLMSNSVSFGDLEKDGLAVEDGKIAAPTIEIDSATTTEKGSNFSSVKLTIQFTGGSCTYYTGFGPTAKKQTADIAGTKIVFDVNLNIAQLAQTLVRNNKAIPKSVKAILEKFSPDQFTIQHIFIDLENSNMANYDSELSHITLENSVVQKQFGTFLGAWILERQKDQDNPYILGYTAQQSKPSPEAVFEPTGATFGTHPYAYPTGKSSSTLSGLSTLDFLMMTGGRVVPNAAAPQANLVPSVDYQGTAIISDEIFETRYLSQFVLPGISESLKNSLKDLFDLTATWKKDGTAYTLAQDSKTTKKYFGALAGLKTGSYSESHYRVSCTVTLQNGVKDKKGDERSAIVCKGTVGVYLDIHPWPFSPYTESNTKDFTVNIFMSAGVDGEITTYQEFHVAKQVEHSTLSKSEKIGIAITNFVTELITAAGNPAFAAIEKLEKLLATNDSLRGLSGLKGLGVDLKNLKDRVILPAPNTFAYKDLSFSDENDLLLYVSYQTSSS